MTFSKYTRNPMTSKRRRGVLTSRISFMKEPLLGFSISTNNHIEEFQPLPSDCYCRVCHVLQIEQVS